VTRPRPGTFEPDNNRKNNIMTEQPDRLSRLLRLWGRVGFFFFLAVAAILAVIAVVEGQFTGRALLVICTLALLGLVSLGLARLYERIAKKLLPKE
jgi:hypothetical protein